MEINIKLPNKKWNAEMVTTPWKSGVLANSRVDLDNVDSSKHLQN